MAQSDYKVGGFIRVIKAGNWDGKAYAIGDIGEIKAHYERHHLDVKLDNGTYTRLCVDDTNRWSYGIECEFLGMQHPNKEPQYSIF